MVCCWFIVFSLIYLPTYLIFSSVPFQNHFVYNIPFKNSYLTSSYFHMVVIPLGSSIFVSLTQHTFLAHPLFKTQVALI